MAPTPTDEELRQQYHKLCLARGVAMNAYAGIEQNLAVLLATFGDMPSDVGHTIFYQIVNTRARLQILKKLKKRKLGNQYDLFWRSVTEQIKDLDEGRNELAHWHVIPRTPPADWDYVLKSPRPYGYGGEKELTVEKCEEFAAHCTVIDFVLNMFWASLNNAPPPTDAWRDIFQRELVYPPLEGTPLFQMLERRYGPLQASPL
jgi:hypothetical protein